MNQINIIGTITKDIELKYLTSGTPAANFGIAYNEKYKKQDGQIVEKAHFFDVKVIGKKSEILGQYFRKGSRIGITGSLNFELWQDQTSGQNRNKVSIKLNDFTFIDKKSDNQQVQQQQGGYNAPQQQQQYQAPQNNQQQNLPTIDVDEDSIPF